MKEKDYSKFIRELAKTTKDYNLDKIHFEEKDTKIIITKNSVSKNTSNHFIPTPMQESFHDKVIERAPIVAPASPIEEDKAQSYAAHPGVVKSNMVGTVYLAPKPEEPNYVSIGSNVKKGDTLCLLEAMKTFNPIVAHKDGKIIKILVDNLDAVEFEEPLFVID